jgi:5-(carboxyamino)imidazole ribonucleotide synthase
VILPGARLGMLGGGQLGQMFTVAARTMGYRVTVLDPDPDSPAGGIADLHLCAAYQDQAALRQMGESCQVVTTEFENVPAAALEFLRSHCPVRPSAGALAIAQDRIAEKSFARDQGIDTARFAPITTVADLAGALREVGTPALLKTSRLGYDGKGQAAADSLADAERAFESFGRVPCILEERLTLEREVSVVLARSASGEIATFPVGENRHLAGILDTSVVPAGISSALADQARRYAVTLASALDYVGVLGVELFVVAGDRILFNEMAPRPHNSGHYSQDACITDQFEQQVRAVCGLPLGDTSLLSPVCMVNLLGDLWSNGEPQWERALAHPRARLHLYGKREARPGRKMGHLNLLADDPHAALAEALAARAQVKRQ